MQGWPRFLLRSVSGEGAPLPLLVERSDVFLEVRLKTDLIYMGEDIHIYFFYLAHLNSETCPRNMDTSFYNCIILTVLQAT